MFRTNTAYNRFWEGRKIWEKILTNLRDLSRFSVIYSDVIGHQRLQKILNLCCSYPVVLQEHLQGLKQTERLSSFIHRDDLKGDLVDIIIINYNIIVIVIFVLTN